MSSSFATHLPHFDIPSGFRYLATAISSFGIGASVMHWLQLKWKNRKHKIRTHSLEKLCEFLETRTDLPIFIELARPKVFDTHAYYIRVPAEDLDGPETVLSIYTRQAIPKGYYQVECREDCLLFRLFEGELDRLSLTNHSFALLLID